MKWAESLAETKKIWYTDTIIYRRKGEIPMPKFFEDSFSPDAPYLNGEHARHIGYALRMRVGEELTVCACGIDYACEIDEMTADTVYLRILSSEPCCAEPSVKVTLFQALPKADKLELIIRKSVELGATEIVPVLTKRCISRMTPAEFEKKRVRLQKIAKEAAQQSGRGIIPEIAPLHTVAQAANRMKTLDCSIVLYEAEGGISFGDVPHDRSSYGMMVGAEGGFEPDEIEVLASHGVQAVWLGRRILRCETAPLAALSILMFRTGNMN